ncbi:MAG: beta-lactamase family protein [Gammaproteobacteria bacterium]|nr:beta-lactamase family protein [Gammaproteobacteria bacterium]
MRYLIFCLVLLQTGCSSVAPVSLTNQSSERDNEWPTANLEDSGFDVEKMQRLTQRLESGWHPNAHMVLVEYDGKLVYENYLSGEDENWGQPVGHRVFAADSVHDLRSVSKSVTSLLLGIALGDDFETALSRPIIEYFPEFADQVAPGVEQVTLHQVLAMSAGFKWNEMVMPYANKKNDERRLYYAPDPVQYALTRPLHTKPGESWYYNGGMTMVIAALIEKISGKPFLEFAREKLADPLGISEADVEWRGLGIWPSRPTLPSAASGLRATARDLAKIGSLVLHEGRWKDRQIVPRAWVLASTQRHMEQTYPGWSLDGIYGYGYQWWHGNFSGEYGDFTAITAVGYGGQRLFVIPEKKLAVTIFAGNYGNGIWRMSEQVLAEIIAAAP